MARLDGIHSITDTPREPSGGPGGNAAPSPRTRADRPMPGEQVWSGRNVAIESGAMANTPDPIGTPGGMLEIEQSEPKVEEPPRYKVVLLNDDYTPMEFVVGVLERFFGMDREQAVRVMLHVHTRGKGVCGTYSREIAETKVSKVNRFSREHQHPLLCTMEHA